MEIKKNQIQLSESFKNLCAPILVMRTVLADRASPTWEWLLDKFQEQMYSFGIDIFIIDAFNKVLFKENGNKYDLINTCLTKLTSFAQKNNVTIFLVAHPTKMQKNEKTGVYNIPSLYDVSGSADLATRLMMALLFTEISEIHIRAQRIALTFII